VSDQPLLDQVSMSGTMDAHLSSKKEPPPAARLVAQHVLYDGVMVDAHAAATRAAAYWASSLMKVSTTQVHPAQSASCQASCKASPRTCHVPSAAEAFDGNTGTGRLRR
jgi:hypothetical protein